MVAIVLGADVEAGGSMGVCDSCPDSATTSVGTSSEGDVLVGAVAVVVVAFCCLGLLPQKCFDPDRSSLTVNALTLLRKGSLHDSSQAPQANFPIIISRVYTTPFQTIWPENILVMGIENPIDA